MLKEAFVMVCNIYLQALTDLEVQVHKLPVTWYRLLYYQTYWFTVDSSITLV